MIFFSSSGDEAANARSSSPVGNPSPPVSLRESESPFLLQLTVKSINISNHQSRFRGVTKDGPFVHHTSFTLYRLRVTSASELPGQRFCGATGEEARSGRSVSHELRGGFAIAAKKSRSTLLHLVWEYSLRFGAGRPWATS
jgi:hypothetical protein